MKILKFAGAALLVLLGALLFNTLRLPEPRPAAPGGEALATALPDGAIERLAGALRIPTITRGGGADEDWAPFPELHNWLEQSFPQVHAGLRRELVGDYSLLYRWEGTDPDALPILMLAHQDVVPIEPGTGGQWLHPPFDGAVAGGFVWGRGALDDKSSLIAQLEAVEQLLAAGFEPRRTVYFAFGHDEEIGGEQGAGKIAALLEERSIRAEFSLDEGGAITQGVVKGVAPPVAMVATAEKGYVSFRLTARDAGGHSSRPPAISAVGRLAAAVARLEQNPFPPRLGPPVDQMLEQLAPELPLGQRVAIANLWLFRPLVARLLAGAPLTGAMVRTTTAPTVFHAGIKDNVLPTEANAIVNFRIRPGEARATVEARVREVINDPEIELAMEPFSSEPSAVASVDTPAFRAIEAAVGEAFPSAVVVPGLVIGATDNRHYARVRGAGYNFLPVLLSDEDVSRIHGANERIGIAAYARMVQFYASFLANAAASE